MQRSFPVTPADLKRAVDPVLYRVIVNLVRCDVIIYIISSFLNTRESNLHVITYVVFSTLHSLAMYRM